MTEVREETAGLDITDWPSIPPNVTYVPVGKPACYVLLLHDGVLAEGFGTSMKGAEAAALRGWRRWKSTRSGQLAVDGHEYRRRMRARARRRRG